MVIGDQADSGSALVAYVSRSPGGMAVKRLMIMTAAFGLTAALLVPATTEATKLGKKKDDLSAICGGLQGQIVDYTHNHGQDNRIYSKALECKADLYVYLPPCFDPCKQYPIMIYLHGILQDERGFLKHAVGPLDQAIASGKLPPMIVAAPDGSLAEEANMREPGSFFINNKAGDFQDWIVCDVWKFMNETYPIRPEAKAHVIAGVSMGGFGAYNIAIKHRDKFRIVVGVMPCLNIRWMDECGDYFANFDEYHWGWRNSADDPDEIIGRFAHGLVKLKVKDLMYPVFGDGFEGILKASFENPIEMIDRCKVKPCQLDMYVGYGGKDEFNLDAQAESFLFFIKSRGIKAAVYYDPDGKHSETTAEKMIPSIVEFLDDRLRHYCVDQPCPCPDGKKVGKAKPAGTQGTAVDREGGRQAEEEVKREELRMKSC